MAVFAAAELAFHAHPLGNDDFLGVDPLIVCVASGLEYIIDGLPLFRGKAHGLIIPLGFIYWVNTPAFLPFQLSFQDEPTVYQSQWSALAAIRIVGLSGLFFIQVL